jgi:hypothetical protein
MTVDPTGYPRGRFFARRAEPVNVDRPHSAAGRPAFAGKEVVGFRRTHAAPVARQRYVLFPDKIGWKRRAVARALELTARRRSI